MASSASAPPARLLELKDQLKKQTDDAALAAALAEVDSLVDSKAVLLATKIGGVVKKIADERGADTASRAGNKAKELVESWSSKFSSKGCVHGAAVPAPPPTD